MVCHLGAILIYLRPSYFTLSSPEDTFISYIYINISKKVGIIPPQSRTIRHVSSAMPSLRPTSQQQPWCVREPSDVHGECISTVNS